MKKILKSLLAIIFATATLTACGGSGSDETLVVYSPNTDAIVEAIIPMFEQETGIKVELVSAGTGELLKRLDTERENPYADIMFGGLNLQKLEDETIFEEYISVNDDMMTRKNIKGILTPHIADGSNLLINTDLIGNIKIDSYADLLNPELKGKIAMGDPANSSSAFAQLTNILLAVGGDYESQKGWDYVEALIKNLDGKVLNSSSAVHKGVADGEYVVALTYEDPSASYVRDGAPVKIVYPKEGAVWLDTSAAIIKDAKNLENAQKFIDFLTSKEAQDVFGTELTNRPLREDVTLGTHMTPMEEINVIYEDEEYIHEHKQDIIKRYTDIFVKNA
jgi:ABC-type Fe3+ transport system, periplasmic component